LTNFKVHHPIKSVFLDNLTFIQKIALHRQLLEFYGANSFKIRALDSAIDILRGMDTPLETIDLKSLDSIDGLGKGIVSIISEIRETGSIEELEENLDKTPPGVLTLLNIKGMGPKKVKLIWDELGITTPQEVLEAAESNQLSKLKGFGEKTQEKVKKIMAFKLANQGKYRYADVEPISQVLYEALKNIPGIDKVSVTGELRRKLPVVSCLSYLVSSPEPWRMTPEIAQLEPVQPDRELSGPRTVRGVVKDSDLKVEITVCPTELFTRELFLKTASVGHLRQLQHEGYEVYKLLSENQVNTEEDIYKELGLDYIEPELREGTFEIQAGKAYKLPELLKTSDLKGVLHNHTTSISWCCCCTRSISRPFA
jgi:DNA polymerase (family 10)